MSTQASGNLSNPDLAPVPADQRTWSKWNIASLWIGMAVCIPTYMIAGSMIQAGMNWWQAVLTVLLGNLIVLVPMILNGHGGTKYGVPFPVLARASFGTTGAHIPAIARALVACGWFGIQTWIGGAALYAILVALGWITEATDADMIPVLGLSVGQFLCFLAFWAVHVVIVMRGIHSIKWVEAFAAPFLIACSVALLIWAFVNVDSIAALFTTETHRPEGVSFLDLFFPWLTIMVGFWATLSLNIPDFTRYCKSQRDQAMGQLIGLPPTMTLFCFVSIIVTSATILIFGKAIWDPVELIAELGSPTIVVFAMLALLIATLSTNLAANVVSPANGFSNVAPRLIGFRGGAMITCVIGIAIMPWRLIDDLSGWLIAYGALLGPIAGIMLCDYFIIRRTKLQADALYDADGEYGGVNLAAIAALVLALVPNLPGFINAVMGTAGQDTAWFAPFFDTMYGYAWFIGLPLAMLFYWLFMREWDPFKTIHVQTHRPSQE